RSPLPLHDALPISREGGAHSAGNSIIELVLDVPRGERRFRAGRRVGTLFRGGRAPARPAISPRAQVLGSSTVRVPGAISAQVRDCSSDSAHQMPSRPHSQRTSETLTRLIAWRRVLEGPSGGGRPTPPSGA